MADSPAIVVLAAGKGSRLKSQLPKVLHKVANAPMLAHVLRSAASLDPARLAVVVGPGMPEVEALAGRHPGVQVAVQPQQNGTGGAVAAALPLLAGHEGPVLVLYGDTPLVQPATMRALLDALAADPARGVAVLGMRLADGGAYGRLVTAADGTLLRIVEAADATAEELAVTLVNAGPMAIDGRLLPQLLAALRPQNAQAELYLTDLPGHAIATGRSAGVAEASPAEMLGVNTRAELAAVELALQQRLRAAAMAGGATLIDPASTWLSADTVLGRDTVVEPQVVFGPGVTVADDVTIHAFSHLEGCTVARGASIGPYARLRPGTVVGEGARIGNFVETKNAVLGPGAKANHLAYLGDAEIGARANIGAGTITCNYDGFVKSRTVVGEGAFIGSNSALVAPVTVGDGAIVAAGSTIVQDVEAGALAISRAAQVIRPQWATRFRLRRLSAKAS